MEKNFLQDVVPPTQKKSIRNIPIPKGRRKTSMKTEGVVVDDKPLQKEEPVTPRQEVEREVPTANSVNPPKPPTQNNPPSFQESPKKRRGRGGMKKILIPVIILILVIGVVTIMSIFSGAKVEIYPKHAEATLNEIVTLNNVDNSENIDSPKFRVVEVREEKRESIKATGEEEVQSKASGTITIYNEYTESEQPLVQSTRFESPDGLIFRIEESVTVPGMDGDEPGSITVQVSADENGEEYNLSSGTRFSIPGFEGQPQFDGFYAVSQDNFGGGFDGIRKVVSEEDLQEAQISLETELKTSLISQIESQISDEFIAIIDDSLFNFDNLKQEADGNNVNVILGGTLRSLIINKSEISNYLAGESLSTFNPADNVIIEDTSTLSLEVQEESLESGLDSVTLNIDGSASFTWVTDHDALKNSLSGKSRKDLRLVLEEYSSINRAEATISPFWKRSFPNDTNDIDIIELKEE